MIRLFLFRSDSDSHLSTKFESDPDLGSGFLYVNLELIQIWFLVFVSSGGSTASINIQKHNNILIQNYNLFCSQLS